MLNQKGFTFLAALMIVVIMGIMLGLMGQPWKTIMKREREKELLFRGLQIRNAIGSWNMSKAKVTPLNDLKDLLQDPRDLQKKRHLRQLYKDPMTGKEWAIIKDKTGAKGIIGVASTSEDVPLKNSFAEYSGLDGFIGKKKYSDWRFVYGTDPGAELTTVTAPQ
ncbi:type II secretion system protein [Geobacter sp. FeAm09]|uniref:type II secretion system protein n=1 Tax=Geobacter sp. FeAm09 TaxID=2597769 RepID=UPI0011EDA61D|nr:type II secretion system protein [Geobacter sp. FeAm09]QEM69412.1 type II secretion system protein [Geobacter sp. FeAm09]